MRYDKFIPNQNEINRPHGVGIADTVYVMSWNRNNPFSSYPLQARFQKCMGNIIPVHQSLNSTLFLAGTTLNLRWLQWTFFIRLLLFGILYFALLRGALLLCRQLGIFVRILPP